MNHVVLLSDQAEDDLANLDRTVRERVQARLARLGAEPDGRGTKALGGALTGFRRASVGAYRVCYWLDEADQSVRVVAIGHRRAIYERLTRLMDW